MFTATAAAPAVVVEQNSHPLEELVPRYSEHLSAAAVVRIERCPPGRLEAAQQRDPRGTRLAAVVPTNMPPVRAPAPAPRQQRGAPHALASWQSCLRSMFA